MTQEITFGAMPAPSLSDAEGNGIVPNRDVVVQGQDITPGAITGGGNVEFTNALVIPPKFNEGVTGDYSIRVESVNYSGDFGPNPVVNFTAHANFEGFDTSQVSTESQVRAWVSWQGLSTHTSGNIYGSTPAQLIFDTDASNYTPLTTSWTVNFNELMVLGDLNEMSLDLIIEYTDVGFTNTDFTVAITTSRA